MAEANTDPQPATGTTDQAAAAAAPATPAQETPLKGRAILESAKAELKATRNQEPPPADEPAPEPAAAPPPQTPAPEPEAQGSRREQGQRLREQIRKEVQAEFEANQRISEQRRQSEQQQREFDDLVARADGGDWEAKDRVLTIIKSQKGMQTAIMQGRNGVLEELGRDITQAVYSLDGLDDDGQQALLKTPSVAEFGKTAFEQGRRVERAVHEGTIATLKAENESLRGRLAGNGPSPMPSNGTTTTRTPNGRYQSLRDAFAASAAELGYRTQG